MFHGPKLKFLMIEDHPFLRTGLNYMIRQVYPDCQIIEAHTAEQGLLHALNEPFDLVLLDLYLPGTTGGRVSFTQGLAALGALQISPGAPPVIVVSGITREKPAALALQLGAAAVIKKGASPDELWVAMRHCLKDKGTAPPSRAETHEPPPPMSSSAAITSEDLGITPRMHDVLKLALRGHPPKKIAQILSINDSNVRHYLSQLYARFGVTGRTGLQAHFAISGQVMGLISLPDNAVAPGSRDWKRLTLR